MKISGQLVWRDYLQAQFLNGRLAWWQQCLWYAGIGIFLYAFFAYMVPDIPRHSLVEILLYTWPLIVIFGAWLFYRYYWLPRRVRQIFEQHKEMPLPFEHEITPTGLISSNQYGQANRPWENFFKWREDKHLLMLYMSDIQFVMFPKRFCTPEQVEATRGYLRAHHVREANKPSRGSAILWVTLFICILVGVVLLAVLQGQTP